MYIINFGLFYIIGIFLISIIYGIISNGYEITFTIWINMYIRYSVKINDDDIHINFELFKIKNK